MAVLVVIVTDSSQRIHVDFIPRKGNMRRAFPFKATVASRMIIWSGKY